jgi:hypothetical protein
MHRSNNGHTSSSGHHHPGIRDNSGYDLGYSGSTWAGSYARIMAQVKH